MSGEATSESFERALRAALTPVDPPQELATRLEGTLQQLSDLAAEELEAWELGAMRDPRNWVRPMVAATVGAGAGAALVVLRVRSAHRRRRSPDPLELAQRTLKAAVDEARRLRR